ncbi:MAG: SIMPL domain-containing protein [Bacteroidales bacterium]
MRNHLNVIIIGITIILSIFLLTNTYKNRHKGNDTIEVTGLGKQDFKSDLIVWSGSFSQRAEQLKDAYEALKEDMSTIKEYLVSKGVSEEQILFSSVDINKEYDYYYDDNDNRIRKFAGYRLGQSVEIESSEIEKIEGVSREITELIDMGVEFYSNNPQYYYTQLSELKIKMIAAATEDARLRAEKIAENAGASIGELKNANMGIFQIIGQNSNEDYTWGGAFNTSSKMKTATITMKLEFGIK